MTVELVVSIIALWIIIGLCITSGTKSLWKRMIYVMAWPMMVLIAYLKEKSNEV